MTKVQASIVGADVFTSPFCGDVEALFARACILRLSDGRRLTLLSDDDENGMRIVNVSKDGWDVLRQRMSIGLSVIADGCELSIGDIKIDCSGAVIWTSSVARQSAPQKDRSNGLLLARSSLDEAIGRLDQSPLWLAAHRRFEQLCLALQTGSPIDAPVSRLIGAGPGLTPSGDDMLCGLMAAFNATGDSRQNDVHHAIRMHEHATCTTSRDYLDQACRGWWTSSLLKLFEEIDGFSADTSGVRLAINRLAQRGHSSGIDLATGLITGLSISQCRVSPVIPALAAVSAENLIGL